MYFPYLRGRQYELLALQELTKSKLISSLVIPVVEPVKLSPTLVTTITEFCRCQHSISIIENPSVGSFLKELNEVKINSKEATYKDRYLALLDDDCIIHSLLLNPSFEKELNAWKTTGVDQEKCLLVCVDPDQISLFLDNFSNVTPLYTLIPDVSTFRRRVSANKVILTDSFAKKPRNVDYENNGDEFFSENHLYYKNENYIGFADYSVIGQDYQEAGFAPYAVAIHIVYFTAEKSLRIRHFVSESNDDTNNPAQKFYEAVAKLAKWYELNSSTIFVTKGLKGLLNHYKDQTYPGLGTVKKLTLMHHIELISHFLDGEL